MPKSPKLTLLALVLLLLPGCYVIEDEGQSTTLKFSNETLIGLGAAAVLAVLVGIVLCVSSTRRGTGVVVLLLAVGFGALIFPGMVLDRVVITPTEIQQTTGFWFSPTVKGFRYAEVEWITFEERRARRSTNRVWVLHLRGGGSREIDPGDLWDNNEELAVQKLRGFGVQFR